MPEDRVRGRNMVCEVVQNETLETSGRAVGDELRCDATVGEGSERAVSRCRDGGKRAEDIENGSMEP